MGVRGRWAWPWVVVVAAAAVVGARTPSRGVNEIEAFVKRLEYEVRQGSGGGAVYQVEGGAQVDLNLLPDDVIVRQVEDGLDEEFDLVDEANGDKDEGKRKNTTDRAAEDRQRSLMYQGVYVPDGRFNAFVDGVMVNMVVEMKRRQMDPLYFRIYSRGIVEHVPIITGGSSSTTTTTSSTTASPPSSSSFLPPSTSSTRNGRQRGNPIGGGVIRGLTNIKRFGNAEVQIAGNTTLVRGKWLTGPLDIVIDYRANPPRGRAVNRVRTGLAAVQLNGLTLVDRFGAEMEDFDIVSPLFDYMAYYGNRTAAQQDTTEKLLRHLLSDESFLLQILKESYKLASYDKIIPQFGLPTTRFILRGPKASGTVA
ncbi:uncharacterized protein LOC126981915 isoform X2 [Eriocheir sinensis]|uniref:uncharacterized protein LOC126981915 isoform X2 n=1 Tax=Eriocheir sinensis TaxID=95602 RepID=UPI0021CAC0C1|nr:uncharacterized protein LOC126981915 isoform X2 [Eriocheir sinensis]